MSGRLCGSSRTNRAPRADGGADLKIGTWHAWAIKSTRHPGGIRTYEIVDLKKSGDYFRCGTNHDHKLWVLFVDCPTLRVLSEVVARDTSRRFSTLDAAIGAFRRRDKTLLTALGWNAYLLNSAAWARCGDLGCCAAN